MLRVASLVALLNGADAGGPPAVAHWDFSGERPFVDTVHGYELLQANASVPVATPLSQCFYCLIRAFSLTVQNVLDWGIWITKCTPPGTRGG